MGFLPYGCAQLRYVPGELLVVTDDVVHAWLRKEPMLSEYSDRVLLRRMHHNELCVYVCTVGDDDRNFHMVICSGEVGWVSSHDTVLQSIEGSSQ